MNYLDCIEPQIWAILAITGIAVIAWLVVLVSAPDSKKGLFDD